MALDESANRINGTNGTTGTLETVKDVIDGASRHSAIPLWSQMAKFNPPRPDPRCIPHIWHYEDVRPYLIRAVQLVKEKDAERRVLVLVNPERGLQLVMPNETAPAHRHVAFAMRFVIEGSGGFTAVHDGSGPMIWLDGLDLPLFQHFPVHFVEHSKEKRYPAVDVESRDSPIVFPWVDMKEKLDEEEGEWVAREYRDKDGFYGKPTPYLFFPFDRVSESHMITGNSEQNTQLIS